MLKTSYLAIMISLLTVNCQQLFSQKTVGATRIFTNMQVDGSLDDDAWELAEPATDFIQMEPAKGQKATEKTLVLVTYDDKNIYFGINCYHKDASTIVAENRVRDQLSKSEDLIAIQLDTYNDKRSGMVFFVNPLGTQIEMKIADDGRNMDLNWDTEWESAATINEDGWTAEVAIPFQSLPYNNKLRDWGFNIGRVIRHNSETVFWSGVLSDDFRASQAGVLSGLEVPEKKKILYLTPYATLKYEDSDISGVHGKVVPQAGLDAHINISPNITSHLTFNPDFATVEGDEERINMTRWELSFPEKRLFFQEGNELFKTRINTFYSRRIGDISFGGKINGKVKDYTFYAMNSQTKADTSRGLAPANYTSFRVKKDILKSSTLGITYVDKKTDTSYTSSASLDYVLNFGMNWKITGQLVTSFEDNMQGNYGEYISPASAYFIRVANENNIYHVHLRYSYFGEHFQDNVNETGFIKDDDRRELDSDLDYKWWFENSSIKYFGVYTWWNVFWSTENILRSWNTSQKARLYLKNRLSFDLSHSNEFKLYDKDYYNRNYGAVLGYNTDEWSMAKLGWNQGHNFGDDFKWLQADVRFKLLSKMSVSYSFDKIDYKPHEKRSTMINVLSIDYNFTNDLWIRVFAQNSTRNDRIYFYGKFGWRFQPPFGAVYLIYTSDTFEDPLLAGISNNDVAFIKFSYRLGF